MKCPHCGNTLELANPFSYNVLAYGKTITSRTECCHKPVRVACVKTLNVVATTTTDEVDGWGNPYAKEAS
jgi:hypothetical protein